MNCEAQLKTLKEEITTQRGARVDTQELYIHNPMLEERVKEYEMISRQYNDLFESVLPDMNKMSEEYEEVRRKSKMDTFFSR